ncbi:type II toxin-antitoxin system RelB/DinJ family antitoxin [Ruminococcus sp. HUN007]
MAQTTVSIRMDEDLKKDFDSICNDLGMTMTTAVIILAKKNGKRKKIAI